MLGAASDIASRPSTRIFRTVMIDIPLNLLVTEPTSGGTKMKPPALFALHVRCFIVDQIRRILTKVQYTMKTHGHINLR